MATTRRSWSNPDQPWVAPGVLRSIGDDIYTPCGWRRGPDTPDGFWMVSTDRKNWKVCGEERIVAVRVILTPEGKDYRVSARASAYDDLGFAIMKPRLDAEDAYLMAVDVVADMAADPLAILRHAVRLGRSGGAEDGAIPPQRSDQAPEPVTT